MEDNLIKPLKQYFGFDKFKDAWEKLRTYRNQT